MTSDRDLTPGTHDVTRLLEQIGTGHREAADELLPVVYEQLRAIANRHMHRERVDHTLDATCLVHEAWLRLVAQDSLSWSSRRHFYGAAAGAMRRILVEHARRRARQKRGGELQRISLDVADLAVDSDPQDVLNLEEALTRLEQLDPRASEVVGLRFFAGLSELEVAQAMGLSERTVRREWAWARAWLMRELA